MAPPSICAALGPFSTLTLLDGHRAVPQGTTGFAIDPSIVPTVALARVEVVADGASALYGSDAVAGVVNLMLRRDFEGVEASLRGGHGDEYDERQASHHRWHSAGNAAISWPPTNFPLTAISAASTATSSAATSRRAAVAISASRNATPATSWSVA